MKYLVRFEDARALDAYWVGQKFSALARASRSGFAVPPGVAINIEAHRFFISNHKWPEGLADEVSEAASQLGLTDGLSIRSSGIREDLEQQSFAGLYRTFLGVFNERGLKQCIEKCWQSAEAENVRSYLQAAGNEGQIPLVAIILQQMVSASFSGVAFSRNPMRPARKEIVIEAKQGLAENLVSGRTSPYRAFIDTDNRLNVTKPPQSGKRDTQLESQLLQDDQWLAIANLVRELETFADEAPLDIEWAIDGNDKLWLLQFRAVTTLDEHKLIFPAGTWTRKIANDLWADRLTPFLAHELIKNASRYDLTAILKFLGIPVATPTMTVINGYLYVNNTGLAHVLAYIPRRFWISELRTLFPPAFDLDKIPSVELIKKIRVVFRSTLLPFKEPEIFPLTCLWMSPRSQRKIDRRLGDAERLPHDTPRQTLEKLCTALDIMTHIQVKNQWPYSYATVFVWVLRWLVVDRLGLPNSDFLRLLRSAGKNITVEVEQKFRALAKKIYRDAVLKTRFLSEPPEQLALNLPQQFKDEIDNFLKNYGCRSPHRTLQVPRWAEAPEIVIGILQSLLRHQFSRLSASGNADCAASQVAQPRESKELAHNMAGAIWKRREERYQPITRLAVWLIHRLALRFLDLREELRFLLDRALFQIRKNLLVLGNQTGLGEQVLFLNQEELNRFVSAKLSLNEAKLIASQRRQSFSEPFDPSTFFIDGQPVNEFPIDDDVMRGTGTSPGRVTGRARIVEDPGRADIAQGDILIAINTDPGWTPVLSVVSGVVVEEGGLLNHCAIVARELGLPSIVGVRQATKKIPEGSVITIDGGLGLVRIEQPRTL
ncbi:MAG: PEP/pyruvate-binding domain-containing protein [Desulfobacterales bacterium]|jgi:pyruvate,water dikinase